MDAPLLQPLASALSHLRSFAIYGVIFLCAVVSIILVFFVARDVVRTRRLSRGDALATLGAVFALVSIFISLAWPSSGSPPPKETPSSDGSSFTAPSAATAAPTATPTATASATASATAIAVAPPDPSSAAGYRVKPIVDEPGTDLVFVQFDYDPLYADGSLRLFLCVESNYYRILSQEKHPNPRMLFDGNFPRPRGNGCDVRYPVIALAVGDIQEVGIGTGATPEEAYDNMISYTIRRTDDAIVLDRIDRTLSSEG